jgi:hypothetical protein
MIEVGNIYLFLLVVKMRNSTQHSQRVVSGLADWRFVSIGFELKH